MKYFVFLTLFFGFMSRNEAIGWICLCLACWAPILKLGFAWSAQMRKENSKCGPAIDEDGFYL